MNSTTHYSNTHFNPMQMKTQGMGACGKRGTVTGYPGAVTCSYCREIAEADKAAMKSNTTTKA